MGILLKHYIGLGGLACAWLLAGCGGGGGAPARGDTSANQGGTAGAIATPPTQAASCSYPAVQAAVAAAQAGDTVTIPAGDCDWADKQLTIKAGIAIKGAGRDATVLRRTAAMTGNNYLISYDCSKGGQAAFSDMTLVGADLPTSEDRGLGLIGGCMDFTVTRSKFAHFVFAGVEVRRSAASSSGTSSSATTTAQCTTSAMAWWCSATAAGPTWNSAPPMRCSSRTTP